MAAILSRPQCVKTTHISLLQASHIVSTSHCYNKTPHLCVLQIISNIDKWHNKGFVQFCDKNY